MKTLKEALFSRRNINSNPYGLTKDDLKGGIKDFPMGVVVRMMEEQELQGNKADVKVFQKYNMDANEGFEWIRTEGGQGFWYKVISFRDFNLFFEKYPDYERYNLS